jgi:hypothetical protein
MNHHIYKHFIVNRVFTNNNNEQMETNINAQAIIIFLLVVGLFWLYHKLNDNES